MHPQQNGRDAILIVEDNPDHCLILQFSFEEANIRNPLCFFSDGEQLLEYLTLHDGKESRPALILLDLIMPRKGGLETLKELKADPRFRTIPVVIISSLRKDKYITQAYQFGASGYIEKPLKLEDFEKVLITIGEYWFHTVILPSRGN